MRVKARHFHLGMNKLFGSIPSKLFLSNMNLIHAGVSKKSSGSARLVMTTIIGMVFGYFIRVSFTSVYLTKDYAMELDKTHICNAAHLMVASLVGSLAYVTCKEPLCGSISSQLRNSLQGLNIASELEQAVQLVNNDNLDLGCALIEQAATKNIGLGWHF